MKKVPAFLGYLVTALIITLSPKVNAKGNQDFPGVYSQWQTFYAGKNGLPDDHIFALKSDGERLWVGTEGGLACFKNGKWKSWTANDGLPWDQILAIDVSTITGDVWLASFGGGLIRFTGGRFDQFTQLNSGLINDVVYGVAVVGDEVWTATAAGISAYNTLTDQWQIFTEKNAPMEEIWCYNIHGSGTKVHVAVWGGGILVWDTETQRWDRHLDPDTEMEMDLFRDDGLIHNITTAVSYVDQTMWAATYFGFNRYDGKNWRGFMDHDSGLSSNFINFIEGISSSSALVATDKGLSVITDHSSGSWIIYQRDNDEVKNWTAHIHRGNKELTTIETNLSLPNQFVITTTMHQNELWIGTGHGLARGFNSN